MKKIGLFALILCLMLSLCACTDTPKNNKPDDTTNSGDTTPNEDAAPTLDPTAKELLSSVFHSSVYTRMDGSTSSEVILVDLQWSDNGLIAEGYEEDSSGRNTVRMEVTLDEQKRPATLTRTITSPDGEVEENRATFSYPNERTLKLTNYGFGDGESYVIYEYNDKGLLIREEYPNYIRTYTYDDHDNCVKEALDYVDDTTADDWEKTTVYTYNAEGKATFSVETNQNTGKEVQCTYYYYPNGNLMYVVEVTSDGNVNTNFRPYNPATMLGWDYGKSASGGIECTAIKDKNGRIIRVEGVNNHSGQSVTTTLTYDDKGNLIAYDSFYGATYRWEYDAQNRPVKKTQTYNGITDTHTYTYDDLGRLVKEEMTSTQSKSTVDVREYNDAGAVTKRVETQVYSGGDTSTYTMELEYVENAQCPISEDWVAFFLQNVLGGF